MPTCHHAHMPPRDLVAQVGSGPRHDLVVLGRDDRPGHLRSRHRRAPHLKQKRPRTKGFLPRPPACSISRLPSKPFQFWPTGPSFNWSTNAACLAHRASEPPVLVSSCRASSRLRRTHLCTFAQEHRSDLHLCTASDVSRSGQPALCSTDQLMLPRPEPPGLRVSRLRPLVHVSPCPRAPSRSRRVPPCQLASVPPHGSAVCPSR
jgi:hypothetical protein